MLSCLGYNLVSTFDAVVFTSLALPKKLKSKIFKLSFSSIHTTQWIPPVVIFVHFNMLQLAQHVGYKNSCFQIVYMLEMGGCNTLLHFSCPTYADAHWFFTVNMCLFWAVVLYFWISIINMQVICNRAFPWSKHKFNRSVAAKNCQGDPAGNPCVRGDVEL